MNWKKFDYEKPPAAGIYWMIVSSLDGEGNQSYIVELVDYSWNPDVDEDSGLEHYFDIVEIDSNDRAGDKLVLLYKPVEREPLPDDIA